MSDSLKAWLPCLEHGSLGRHSWYDGKQHDEVCPGGREVLLVPTDLDALIDTIRKWSKAYPLDVFTEPGEGETVTDAISASMGRHVIGRLMELIPDAAVGDTYMIQEVE